MERLTERLVDFVAEMSFDRLPHEVVHETKRALLDCIGCGIPGAVTEKGRFAAEVALELGGGCRRRALSAPTRRPLVPMPLSPTAS